jgi:3D (Asp-Asp-Asp) domain-containing protein
MKKSLVEMVMSFLLLLTMMITPALAGYEPQLFATDSESETLLYGPPVPVNFPQHPPLPSRGSSLLKDVLTFIPETLAYTVKRGDSLYEIAQAFGTTVEELLKWNPLENPNLLSIGQELQVPNTARAEIKTDYKIKQVMTADLTAYTAGPESTGKYPGHPAYGITASGKKVKEHHTIATDPSVIPLGTKVYIEGIGIRTAEDTGGAIVGNRIDVYMDDLAAAIKFGVKRGIKVYILEETDQSA